MVSESQRLLYVPIAKCACTTLKTLMIELADIPHRELASLMGVHWVTDRFNTGVQLKDKPMAAAREILASQDYFKFTVVRDPVERILSAYLEKFVYKRHNPRNLLHTRPVLEQVQQSADIDIERGITFEEFVAHITQCSPHDLDSHWRPQYLYIKGVPHFHGIYRLEHIDQLASDLGEHLGRGITLDHQNRTEKSTSMLDGAARMLPGDIEAAGSIDPASLLDETIRDRLASYYSEDVQLYHQAGR
nr:sulfotransferase family 2 domain-containing protein [Parahaliea mediterranea]